MVVLKKVPVTALAAEWPVTSVALGKRRYCALAFRRRRLPFRYLPGLKFIRHTAFSCIDLLPDRDIADVQEDKSPAACAPCG
jgi:hypothetical protein